MFENRLEGHRAMGYQVARAGEFEERSRKTSDIIEHDPEERSTGEEELF